MLMGGKKVKNNWKRIASLTAAAVLTAAALSMPVWAQDAAKQNQLPGYVRLEGDLNWEDWALSLSLIHISEPTRH